MHTRRMKRFPLVLFLVACLSRLSLPGLLAGENKSIPAAPEGVEWALIELNGKAVVAPAGEQGPPTLRFDAEKKQVSGFSGVNHFFGGAEKEGEKLKLGPLAGTMMAGPPEAMAVESAFLKVLESANRWRIADGKLELRRDEEVVARFSVKPAAR